MPKITPKREKISDYYLEKKQILLEDKKNYLIRVGLGGPEGYYGTGMSRSHFGIVDNNSKLVNLFSVL